MIRDGRARGAGLLLLVVMVLAGLPAAAEPSPTPVAPEAPLLVHITELLPRAPAPGDAVEVTGSLRNLGGTTISGIQVRLRVGAPITTRGALHDADTDRPVTTSRSQTAVAPKVSTLLPGGVTPFTIRTTVRVLGLANLGVYPLDVEARGDAGDGFHPLGLAPTWIPYFGALHVQPTRVAVVWPLVDRPHQRTLGGFVDDELATALSGTGRLGRLLAAGAAAATPQCERRVARPTTAAPTPIALAAPPRCEPVRVTYAVDPDLLLAAGTMTQPYRVGEGNSAAKGGGEIVARTWLEGLTRAAPAGLIALPYGDPDVTAMTRATDISLRDDLSLATVLGRAAVAETLHVMPLQIAAWPPTGVVTPAAADLLSRGGARALVLDSSAYDPPENEPPRVPSARTLLPSSSGTPLEGLVADPDLSDLVTGPHAGDLGARLAEQRFLAETAIIAAEAPSLSRTLVIAPDRRGDVNPAAATGALRDLGRVPWLCPVTLAAVAEDRERCLGRPTVASPLPKDRGPLRTADAGELSQTYLDQVAAERRIAVQLTDAVLTAITDPAVTAMKARLRRAVARAESSAWRTDDAGGAAALGDLRRDLAGLVGRVVVRGGQVLLTSTSGAIQVNVDNTLDVPVTVRVRFQPRTLGLVTSTSPLIEIAPGHAVQVSTHATAQRSGQFFVDAQLVDQNGQDFGNPTVVHVRSTRYGRLALALTIGGAGVLLIAAAARLVRRALRRTA